MQSETLTVRRCWPFFWRECTECGLFCRHEIGFKVTRAMFGRSETDFICKDCASWTGVVGKVSTFPDSLWLLGNRRYQG